MEPYIPGDALVFIILILAGSWLLALKERRQEAKERSKQSVLKAWFKK